jgi:cytosine/adenosine deaminase-related metal-dependent hydrolase
MSGSLVRARCPVVELCEAGATVAVVTDGAAPRTSFELLSLPRIAQRLQQVHLGDMSVLPAGRLLAMVTIDAARALGLEAEIGSIEEGKRADLVLLDARRPHLAPPLMPVHRIVHAATGSDVDTVIVEGRVLMERRRVLAADTGAILDDAAREADAVIRRAGLAPFMQPPEGFWSRTYGRITDDRAGGVPPVP